MPTTPVSITDLYRDLDRRVARLERDATTGIVQTPEFIATTSNVALRFMATTIDATTKDGAGWQSVRGTSFLAQSDARTKTEVAPVRTNALDILRAAPVGEWKFLGKDTPHVGPTVQDLPPFMQRSMPTVAIPSALGVDYTDMIGVLWEAVRLLDAELDSTRTNPVTRKTLEERITKLEEV